MKKINELKNGELNKSSNENYEYLYHNYIYPYKDRYNEMIIKVNKDYKNEKRDNLINIIIDMILKDPSPIEEINNEENKLNEKIEIKSALEILESIGYSNSSAKSLLTKNNIDKNSTSINDITFILVKIYTSSSKYKTQAKELYIKITK